MFKIFLILLSSLSLVLPSVLNPTIAEASSSVTYQINNGNDDVNQDGTTFDATSTTVWVGTGQSTSSSYTGLRFNNIAIPSGATINSAKLQFRSSAAYWLQMNLSIAADLSGNSPAFSTSSKPSQRTLTNNKVTHNSNVSWAANTWYTLDEMAPVIQEIVNRSDWSSGNSLSVVLKGTGSAYGRKFTNSYNSSVSNSPKLLITYTVASTPTPTLTPTLTPTPTNSPTPTASPTPTPIPCTLTGASWSTTGPITEGTPVNLNVAGGPECSGQSVSFVISEDDSPFGTDPVSTNPTSTTFDSSAQATTIWISEYQPDGMMGVNDPPEYYFVATAGGQSIQSSTSQELLVNPTPPTPTPTPTEAPTPTDIPTPTLEPTSTPTPEPTLIPTPTPTSEPTSTPTQTPTPTLIPPTNTPTSVPPTQTPTPTPTPTPTNTPLNNSALSFDGNDDAVNGPLYSGNTGTQTIEAWIKPTSFRSDGGGEVVLHDRFDDDTKGWIMEIKRDPVVNRVSAEFWIFDGTVSGGGGGGGDGSSDIVLVNNLVNIGSNNWYHLAATYDSSSHLLKLFVNGQSVQKTMPALTTGFKTRMGTFGGGANPLYKTFTGQIDEVRISSNIRYGSNFTPPTTFFTPDPSTLLLYHFDEGSGQNINDSSSSNVTLNLGTNSSTEASDPTWTSSNVPLGGSGGGPTSTPTPTGISTPTPTSTPAPTGSPVAPFKIGAGLNENLSHQVVRTQNDRLYTFFMQGQYSSVIKAAWTTSPGLPNSLADFTGSTQLTESDVPISLDTVYDGTSLIHVFLNLHNGSLVDHPFDLTTNTFKPEITLNTGLSGISGDYQGTQGVSAMMAANGTIHFAYWGTGNHIIYRSYNYSSVSNNFTIVDSPTQLDSTGTANHPELAISPLDGSITVAWINGTGGSGVTISTRSKTGSSWGSIQQVNTSVPWASTSFGINIDQGPSLLITTDGVRHLAYIGNYGTCGMDYGRMHYVKNSGSGWTDQAISTFCSHAPTLATNSSNEIYLIGHGHPSNPSCTSMLDVCSIKLNSNGTWALPQTLITHSGPDGFDNSITAKWSIVGWNRPETIEFLFFSTISGSYSNTNLWYGRL